MVEQKLELQRERNGALFGVHGVVRSKKCLTAPTLLETGFINNNRDTSRYTHSNEEHATCVLLLAADDVFDLALGTECAGQTVPSSDQWGEKFNSTGATLTYREVGRVAPFAIWNFFGEHNPSCKCCKFPDVYENAVLSAAPLRNQNRNEIVRRHVVFVVYRASHYGDQALVESDDFAPFQSLVVDTAKVHP